MNRSQVLEWREKARRQHGKIAQALKADLPERPDEQTLREYHEALAQLRYLPWPCFT